MNIGGYEFQVIFCALILLGLTAVALIVDYLKGMNEKLRERQIELMAKHEVVVQQVEEDNTRLLRALAEQSKAFREMHKRSMVVSTNFSGKQLPEITLHPEPEQSSVPGEEVLAEAGPVAVADPVESQPQEPATNSQEMLPPNVIRLELKPAEQKARSAEPDFDSFLERLVTEFQEQPDPEPAENAGTGTPNLEELAQRIEEFEPSLEVPAGMQQPAVLHQLMERKELFTGLVVSVGINDYLKLEQTHGHAAAAELLNSVDAVMSEIAGIDGFCCRRGDDEFVLLFPSLGGPKSQQQLNQISEHLWNYQLQTLGTFSVVFSLGAREARRQALAEAVQTASDNMLETREARKVNASGNDGKQRATA